VLIFDTKRVYFFERERLKISKRLKNPTINTAELKSRRTTRGFIRYTGFVLLKRYRWACARLSARRQSSPSTEQTKTAWYWTNIIPIHASGVPRYGSKRMLWGLKSGQTFCKICNFSLYLIQNSLNGT
jgi:hypothetical protein